MKSPEIWQPSKYVWKNGKLVASRNPQNVYVASRLFADACARPYGLHLKSHAKGRLLDLGCGNVPLYGVYRELVDDVVCVDWANTQHPNPHLDHQCDLNQPLPLESSSFDTIILSDVLEHIRKPESLWLEMHRVLKPSGRLVMNVPFLYWLHEVPHDYYRYTEHALRAFAEESGFTVLLLEPIGGAPEVLADLMAKNLLRLRFFGKPAAIFLQWLTASFVQIGLGRKASRVTAATFPLGYFVVAAKP